MKRLAWGMLLLGLLLAGCLPAPPPPALPTATTTFTPVATPTVQWFPPTSTPTPLPPTLAPTPTPNLQADVGASLLTAPFASAAHWRSPTGYAGRFGVADGVLSLTVTRRRGVMLALWREPLAADLYLTVQAEPQVCRGGDAYGVVVRATANGGRYYRFGLTCEGQAFVESVEGGLPIPQATPQPGGVPAGAPVRSVLSVRAAGKRLYFAVNGAVLFAVDDPYPRYGRDYIGLFARAAGEEGVIVAFRRLEAYRLP